MTSLAGSRLTGPTADMIEGILHLRESLGLVRLPFASEARDEERSLLTAITDQIDDYILPRLMEPQAPVLAVVGGSTGAGKSTLVNSIIGYQVTEPGVLRPTTRAPVLVHHPEDAQWFEEARLLPALERSTTTSLDPGKLHLVASEILRPGLALLDAPDFDSIDVQNRAIAAQLMAAADLWIFVTTSARYADQIPWDYLHQAAERSMSVAVVLDRTAPESIGEVRTHLARTLTSRGLRDSPLFTIPEVRLGPDGLLPREIVADILGWLRDFADNAYLKQDIVDKTLQGAIRQLAQRSHALADEVSLQIDRAHTLAESISETFAESGRVAGQRFIRGELLRGALLASWDQLLASGDLTSSLQSWWARFRSRLRGDSPASRSKHAESTIAAFDEGMRLVLLDEAEVTRRRLGDVVRASGLLDREIADDLGVVSVGFIEATARLVASWQERLEDRVAELIATGVVRRVPITDVPGLAVTVAVCAATSVQDEVSPDLNAAEANDAAWQILTTVFGVDTAHLLVAEVTDWLLDLGVSSFALEARRAESEVVRLGLDGDIVERVRLAARRLDDLRFAAQISEGAGW